MSKPKTLVISHDAALIDAVKDITSLIGNLYLETAATLDQARPQLEKKDLALVLLHLNGHSQDRTVAEYARWLSSADEHHYPKVVLSHKYQSDQAVALLRAGASDYYAPIQDMNRLAYLIDVLTMVARSGGSGDESAKNGDLQIRHNPSSVTVALETLDIMDQLRRVIPQETTLLLVGETGTGKTRLARLIHELSPRQNEPFLTVDCGSLSENLIESEMFGHVKGAFTGAERDHAGKFTAVGKGTLLLDEINSLPLHLQSKLLRAVDDHLYEPVGSTKSLPLRARLIVASNTPLEQEVAEGRFRADLYYRLNVVGFFLPPLRERRGSIIPLANKFLAAFARRNKRDIVRFTPDALQALVDYDWPGNIRELRNVMERAVALAPGREITLDDFPEVVRGINGREITFQNRVPVMCEMPAERMTLAKTKEEIEIVRIRQALVKHGNNRLRAAAELGISRMGLYKKLHKYGLMEYK